jgi:DNA-binding MarR family transcriptional regulator
VTETYQQLHDCATRRIDLEWICTAAESELLKLIAELSYGLGQSWCVVPCLADFAAACGIHKSTASRALRSAVQKGYVQILQRQAETLYMVCTTTPANREAHEAESREFARARLRRMNETRDQGRADADGQHRLPGVFAGEEIEAPAAAFEAMMEPRIVPCGTQSMVSPPEDDPLERLMKTMEAKRVQVASPAPPGPPLNAAPAHRQPNPEPLKPPRREVGDQATQWEQMTAGLKDHQLHCLERIREEFASAGSSELASFYQYRDAWRKRASHQTTLYLEAAGVHKAIRLERGNSMQKPGSFMYRSVETAMKIVGGNI